MDVSWALFTSAQLPANVTDSPTNEVISWHVIQIVEVQYIVPQIEPEEGAVGKVLHKKFTLESLRQSKWLKYPSS